MNEIKRYFRSNSIEVFIKYFDVFERNQNERSNKDIYSAFEKNNEEWTPKAFKSRASKGKIIFRKGKEIDALDFIINHAEKISEDLKNEAKKIKARYKNTPTISNETTDILDLSEGQKESIKVKVSQDNLSSEDRKILVKYRIGQSEFRKRLIEYWEGCAVCGCNQPEILVASHIKPWNECEEEEKYDLYNGLLLSPNYDKLFDEYLISFDIDGKIMISNKVTQHSLNTLGISREDSISKNKLTLSHLEYLVEHNLIFNELSAEISS